MPHPTQALQECLDSVDVGDVNFTSSVAFKAIAQAQLLPCNPETETNMQAEYRSSTPDE